jgi:hypothetical protein
VVGVVKTVSISHTIEVPNIDGRAVDLNVEVPDEFAAVIQWLVTERNEYQTGKWDYAEEDLSHAREGLGDESWFWVRGVLNYAGRVRLFGVTNPLGVQALLKLVATLAAIPEHLLRGGDIDGLPTPGLTSGDLGDA